MERRSKERGGEWMGGSTHQDASSASDPLKLSSSSALPGSVAEAEALGIVCGQEPPCHLTAEPLSVAVGFPKPSLPSEPLRSLYVVLDYDVLQYQ